MRCKPLLSIARFEDFVHKRDNYTWLETQDIMLNLLSGPISSHRMHGLVYKLMLLEAISSGGKPLDQLGRMNNELRAPQVLEQLNCSLEQLHADTVNHLGELFAATFSTDALAFLSSVSLENDHQLTLQFDVRLPPATTELEVKFSATAVLWYLTLHPYGDELLTGLFQEQLDRFAYNFKILFKYLHVGSPLRPFWSFVHNTNVELIFHDGQILDLQPVDTRMMEQAYEYKIETRWSHITNTTDCDQVPYEWCMETCKLKAHKEACDCVPWHMRHLDPGAQLCLMPCSDHQEPTKCYTECESVHYCALQEYLVLHTAEPYTRSNESSVFLQARLALQKNLHIKLIEENGKSLGNLFATIGSLLDFGLGLNVIVFVHFFMYIMLATLSYIKRRAYDRNKQIKELRKLKTELETLQILIKTKMDKLLKARAAETGSQKDKHFSWLTKNEFYDQTPITGFSFISAAQSIVEAGFWWFFIILFSIFTVFNVTSAVMAYREKLTQVAVSVAHSDELELQTFTLSFRWSMLDLVQTLPIKVTQQIAHNPFMQYRGAPVAEQFMCAFGFEFMYYEPPDDMFLSWLHESGQWTVGKQDYNKRPFSTEQTLKDWHSTFDTVSKDLLSFLHDVSSIDQYGMEKVEFQNLWEDLSLLLSQPLDRVHDSHMLFLVLEALKMPEPSQHLFEFMLDVSKRFKDESEVQHLSDDKQTILILFDNLFTQIDALDLYTQAQNAMSKMLHVEILDEPDTSVHLKDWSHVWHDEDIMDQFFTLVVMLPANKTRTSLHLTARSYLYMYYQYIFDTFGIYLEEKGNIHNEMCDGFDDFEFFRAISLYEMYYYWDTFITDPIYFEIQSGDTYTLAAAQTMELSTEPKLTLDRTNISHCTNLALDECLENCYISESKRKCGCVPWTLFYRERNVGAVCKELCNIEKEYCFNQCDQPCNTQLYRIRQNMFKNVHDVYRDRVVHHRHCTTKRQENRGQPVVFFLLYSW